MTRRRFAAACLSLCVLAATSLGAHDLFRFVGSVTKMDTAKSRMSLKFKEWNGKDETVEMAVLPWTTILRDNKEVPKSELKVGLSVVVDALGDDYDNLEASEIKIVPPPAK